VKLDPALDLMVDTFIRSRPAHNRFAVSDIGAINAGDRFQAQPRTPSRLAEDGDDIVLICAGGELKFAPEQRPALELALGGSPFGAADLKAEKPEGIISTLLAYGLISRV
jgi:hypothetical protein